MLKYQCITKYRTNYAKNTMLTDVHLNYVLQFEQITGFPTRETMPLGQVDYE